jgi:hypothetical protein
MKDKVGLIFSHIHVRSHEMHKFDMLESCINHFNGFDLDFYFVVCGHGIEIPESIKEKIHNHYWEPDIDNNEIGRGHPKFCIKGYEILVKNNIEKSLKMRSSDLLINEEEFINLLHKDKIIFSEQTSAARGMIGDLFMMGNSKDVLALWTESKWDYNKSGLYNLFDNARSSSLKKDVDMSKYLKEAYLFTNPEEIGWMTLDNNWDAQNNTTIEGFSNKHLWGHIQGYDYYGGF